MRPALALLMALTTSAAHAEFMTGSDLHDKMRGSMVEQMVALGYVQGVFDALRGSHHCPPRVVQAGQINDMVQQHLTLYPQVRHFTADIIVGYVLGKAWPCAKGSGT